MAPILLTIETETLLREGWGVAAFVKVFGNLNAINCPLLKVPDKT